MTKTAIYDRFMAKVEPCPASGCWLWTAHVDGSNRGRFQLNRRNVKASRVSWELHRGAIPEGMYVLHHCDNTYCVNPWHCFLGTDADNSRDKVNKGRQSRLPGALNGRAILTEDIVRIARREYQAGRSMKEMAATFGVHTFTIWQAVTGRTWKHI